MPPRATPPQNPGRRRAGLAEGKRPSARTSVPATPRPGTPSSNPEGLSGVVRQARTYCGWHTTGQESLPPSRRTRVTNAPPTRLFFQDPQRDPGGTGAYPLSNPQQCCFFGRPQAGLRHRTRMTLKRPLSALPILPSARPDVPERRWHSKRVSTKRAARASPKPLESVCTPLDERRTHLAGPHIPLRRRDFGGGHGRRRHVRRRHHARGVAGAAPGTA